MNESHIKGKFNDTKGKINDEVGRATNKPSMSGEGKLDQVKGKLQEGFADAKDAVKRGIDHVLHPEKENNPY